MDNGMTKKEETAVAPNNIAEMNKGVEDLDIDDVVLPRCKLIQAMNKEHTEHGLPLAHYANSISLEDYGEKIDFVCLFAKKGWLKFAPKEEGGGLIARKFTNDFLPSLNPETITAEDKKWDNVNGKKPVATLVYCYVGIINGKDIASISFMNTAIKMAKKFNTMLTMNEGPAFEKHYTLSSTKKTNEADQDYFVPSVRPNGYLTTEEKVKANMLFDKYSKKQIDTEVVDTAESTGAAKENKEEAF